MDKTNLEHAKNLKWFEHFTKICEINNIWYVVTNGTLLGAVREKGPIEWDDDYDVMMTPESYNKLKILFPKNCIDTSNEDKYPLVIPKFIPDKNEYLNSAIFVDIFLVVPSNNKKVKNFRSILRKINFSLQAIHSVWEPYAWYIKLYKWLSWPFKFFIKKMTYKKAIQILKCDNEYQYYFSIDNPIDPKKINIIKTLSFATKLKKFSNFYVKVPIEYHDILTVKYNDYMIPNKWQRPFIHINAVSIKKIKKNKD